MNQDASLNWNVHSVEANWNTNPTYYSPTRGYAPTWSIPKMCPWNYNLAPTLTKTHSHSSRRTIMSDYSIGYTVIDEDNVPPELTEAKARGDDFQCTSMIGWIDLAPDDLTYFRNSNTYRFRKHG